MEEPNRVNFLRGIYDFTRKKKLFFTYILKKKNMF